MNGNETKKAKRKIAGKLRIMTLSDAKALKTGVMRILPPVLTTRFAQPYPKIGERG